MGLVIHHSELDSKVGENATRWVKFFGEKTAGICIYLCGDPSFFHREAVKGNFCIHQVVVPAEIDNYSRSLSLMSKWSPMGIKSGPNWQFFRVLEAHSDKHPLDDFFLVELDAHPIKQAGSNGIAGLLERKPHVWVLGAVNPASTLKILANPNLDLHINGVAIYRTTSLQFRDFLDLVWLPSLIHLAHTMPEIAFDVVNAPALWGSLPSPLREQWESNSARFVSSSLIANLSNQKVRRVFFESDRLGFLKSVQIPDSVVVHIKLVD